MCGICGIAGAPGQLVRAHLLEDMCRAMSHRGPDEQGFVIRGSVALGMTRLSIIDLESGQQPVHSEDGRAWIVFNGEIYNYRELREELLGLGHRMYTKSDTEVALHAYEQWGPNCLKRLNGMFALAIWDERTRTLFLARDRMGIKPLHYVQLSGGLAFASEIKALLRLPRVTAEVDPQALADYLVLEFVPSPNTMLRAVRKLPPGHHASWCEVDRSLSVRRYWDVTLTDDEHPRGWDPDQCAKQLRDLIREVVRKELVADVPVGVFLSGGIDSSTVAAMMCELQPSGVNSFSIGFTDPSFDESNYARLVARHLGTTHHELLLEPQTVHDLIPEVTLKLDEPLADASIIATYLLSRFTREHVKVALGGDGGDELFAGYPTLLAHKLATYYRRLPKLLRGGLIPAAVTRLPVSFDNLSFDFKARRFIAGADHSLGERHVRWMGAFAPSDVLEILTPEMAEMLTSPPGAEPVARHLRVMGASAELTQVLYLDMKLYLENDILVKLDRASMMASLEARVPLLNVDLVEYAARLPLSLKLRGWQSKYLLKRAMRGKLPEAVLNRSKKGFGIPLARWFQGPLREFLLDTLSESQLRQHGHFRSEVVQRLIDDHLAGRQDNRKPLWALLAYQRWYDTYVASQKVTLPRRMS